MLKRRLAQNLSANLFAQAVTVISQLGLVPLFLSFWSPERYGVWLMISAIPGYLSLGEAGFATASANEMSMAVAAGDHDKALRSLHTAWGFLLSISITLIVLVAGALGLVAWRGWFHCEGISTGDLCSVLGLLSLYTIVGICMAIFSGIYRAAYKNARNLSINTGGRLAELAATSILVVTGYSIMHVALAMLVVRSLTFMTLFFDSQRLPVRLRLGLNAFSWGELKKAWWPASMFMASSLGNALYFQGLTLLVGAVLGPVPLVLFNTTRTLTRVIVQCVTVVKLSLVPEFSYLVGRKDIRKASQLCDLALEISWFLTTALAVLIFSFAPLIMGIWTNGKVTVDRTLVAVLLASAVLNGVWYSVSGLLTGTNQHGGLTLRYLLSASSALALAALLISRIHLYGVALAMIICEIILLPYCISEICRLLNQSAAQMVYRSARMCAVRHLLRADLGRTLKVIKPNI